MPLGTVGGGGAVNTPQPTLHQAVTGWSPGGVKGVEVLPRNWKADSRLRRAWTLKQESFLKDGEGSKLPLPSIP